MLLRIALQLRRSAVTFRALAVGWIVLIAPVALAQISAAAPSEAKPATFGAVTIKPHDPATPPYSWDLEPTPDGLDGKNVSLYRLVQEAYGVSGSKLTGGPSWIDKEKFDLEARFDPANMPNVTDLSYRQRADMLRAVLADRFHLKVHHETKGIPVYNLVVAKGGPKLTETKPEDVLQGASGARCLFRHSSSGYMQVQGCRPGDLLDALLSITGHTVIDKTGITARYDFELHWTPENIPASFPNAGGPSIFTAMQEQLGLKLEPATAPLNILVIDSAEMPSEN